MNSHYRAGVGWAWACGSLATGSVFNAMALFALFYMTSVLGVEPALAGALLFFIRLYDAVTDPLMGTISDHTTHRWGPQRPYLLIGAIALAVSFALFFNLSGLATGNVAAWLIVALVLYSTSYTVLAVPYLAMPPMLAPSYDDRTRLMSIRLFFLIVGVFIGSSGGPLLVAMAGDGASGYSALGFGLGSLALAAGLVAFLGTRSVRPQSARRTGSAGEGPTWRGSLRQAVAIFEHAPFRLLTIVKLLQLAVLALVLTCTPYFFKYVLERSTTDISLYLGVFSAAGLLSVPFWRWVIGRYGKRDTYILSIILYGAGMASWFVWQTGEPEFFFYGRAVILGVLSNGTLLCALSLLPDTMEYDQLKSGESREGIMSGAFTTIEKIAGALGPLTIGVLLQTMGFDTSEGAATQPASAILAIKSGISLLPAVLCLAAIPALIAYRLGPGELAALRSPQASQR